MKGVYLLIVHIKKEIRIKIGALGYVSFSKGFYAYIGSALNGLESRLARHASIKKRKHWHIDYLTSSSHSRIIYAISAITNERMECKLSHALSSFSESIKGFGCSDCSCDSHLYRLYELDRDRIIEIFYALGLDPMILKIE